MHILILYIYIFLWTNSSVRAHRIRTREKWKMNGHVSGRAKESLSKCAIAARIFIKKHTVESIHVPAMIYHHLLMNACVAGPATDDALEKYKYWFVECYVELFEQTAAFTTAELCMRIRNVRARKKSAANKKKGSSERGKEREQQQKKIVQTNGWSRQSPDVSSFKQNIKQNEEEKRTRNESRKTHRLWLMAFELWDFLLWLVPCAAAAATSFDRYHCLNFKPLKPMANARTKVTCGIAPCSWEAKVCSFFPRRCNGIVYSFAVHLSVCM